MVRKPWGKTIYKMDDYFVNDVQIDVTEVGVILYFNKFGIGLMGVELSWDRIAAEYSEMYESLDLVREGK